MLCDHNDVQIFAEFGTCKTSKCALVILMLGECGLPSREMVEWVHLATVLKSETVVLVPWNHIRFLCWKGQSRQSLKFHLTVELA